eukprot:1044984-Alexandrium_andersonii.AAC.1
MSPDECPCAVVIAGAVYFYFRALVFGAAPTPTVWARFAARRCGNRQPRDAPARHLRRRPS